MDRNNSHDKFSGKTKMKPQKSKGSSNAMQFPIVAIDSDSDFASIKLAPGIEARTYLKDGVLFSEDAKGRIIEIQILNLNLTTQPKQTKPKPKSLLNP